MKTGRPMTTMSMIEELGMEITAKVLKLEDSELHPTEVREMLDAVKICSNTICSLTSGVRTPKDDMTSKLVKVMEGPCAAV